MTIPRIRWEHPVAGTVILTGQEHRYLKNVLRVREGEAIFVVAPNGEFAAKIVSLDEKQVAIAIGAVVARNEPSCRITIAQALLKTDKMELIVQKMSELGVAALVPFVSQRTVSRPEPDKLKLKRERWEKISDEAARKSLRSAPTVIKPVVALEGMLASAPAASLKAICWEEEAGLDLRTFIASSPPMSEAIFFVIGPEGGFAAEEVAAAHARGFASVSLGPALLKAETAAIATAAVLCYTFGSFGVNPRRLLEEEKK